MGKRFNVGDKVKIVRKVCRENGASYFWTDSMDALIGKVGEVVESRLYLDYRTYKVLVEGTTYLWDEKALEAVDKKESKMEVTKSTTKQMVYVEKEIPTYTFKLTEEEAKCLRTLTQYIGGDHEVHYMAERLERALTSAGVEYFKRDFDVAIKTFGSGLYFDKVEK